MIYPDDYDDDGKHTGPGKRLPQKTHRNPVDNLDVLVAGLTRNTVLVSVLSVTLFAAGARTIPNVGADQQTADVVWIGLMSGASGLVQIIGVISQIRVYLRVHAENGVKVDWEWVVLAVALMITIVALFSITYPILFVVVDT